MLSEKHLVGEQKLHFTLAPDFGFVFFLRGAELDHFCWELLGSNASYLWSFPRCLDEIAIRKWLDRLEEEIGRIRAVGRDEYRRIARNTPDMNGMSFYAIHHTKAEIAPDVAFERWREELECRL